MTHPLGEARKDRELLTPKVDSKVGKLNPSQASRKYGKGGPDKADPSQIEKIRGLRPPIGPQQSQVRAVQGEDAPWTQVERKKKMKKP